VSAVTGGATARFDVATRAPVDHDGVMDEDWREAEAEARREQVALYRQMTDAERWREALRFDREARRWTAAVDLRGSAVDRERDAAMERVERATG